MSTIIISFIILAAVALAVRRIYKNHKEGKCSGGCAGCSGCSAHPNKSK